MTIALTAPTGKVGTAVLAAAAARGVAVRALARPAFDFADPATYVPCLAGVDTLILVAPSSPQQAAQEIAVADAALAAGVGHIIKLSVQGAESGSITFAKLHRESELHLLASGAAVTLLRPTFFMQNTLGLADPIRSGVFPAAMANAHIGQIDTADIGDVAIAAALDRSKHAGKTYDLTGPAAYTGEEIAAILTAAIGKPIRYVDVPEDAFRASLLQAGLDAWYAQGLVELYQVVRAGYTAAISDDVRTVTGRAPRSFDAFVSANAQAFR